jgi:hypothetical protein
MISVEFVYFLMFYPLILSLELFLVEVVEVKVALMLLGVSVLRAKHIIAAALHPRQTDLLLATETSRLVLLRKRLDDFRLPVSVFVASEQQQ